ncbi:hypothetical protein LTS17_011605 [Exophiala oligosperma]
MPEKTFEPQVVVIGAGPVGCLLSLRLVRAGIPVCLIEKDPEIQPHFRALGYPGSTHAALYKAGIWEEANERGFTKEGFSWRKPPRLLKEHETELPWGDVVVNWNPYIDSPLKPGDIGYGMIALPQNKFREIIMPRLLAASELADVRLGYEMVKLSQNTTSVTVTAKGPGGEHLEITAPYLVGADGAKSMVRKSLGQHLEGFTWPDIVVAVDAYVNLPAPADSFPSLYVLDPKDYAFMAKMDRPGENGKDRDLWRMTIAMSPEECEPDVFDQILKEKIERLTPGPRPLRYELLRAQPYRLHQRHVQSMLQGRCLLIGDAAHLTNPFGGLGLTTGILDADSLGDSLLYVLKEGRSAEILQRWADARLAVFKDIVSPAATENKLRCHETSMEDPYSDPFFRMVRDNAPELVTMNQGFQRIVTDMSKLLGKRPELGPDPRAAL